MKVASGLVYDNFGGVSQHILNLQKYSSHQIHVFPPASIRFFLKKSPFRNVNQAVMRNYLRFLNKVGLSNYDIVHSHPDPFFIDLCAKSRSQTCRWVHTYHTLFFPEDYTPSVLSEQQQRANQRLLTVASQADLKICASNWLQGYLQEKYNITTTVIPNGVDVAACSKARPDAFIEKYGFSNFVLFVGYLDQIKDPDMFIKLADNLPETCFLMVGRGFTQVNLQNLHQAALPKNLFLLNELSHSDLFNAMSACKAFVMTSKREGCPTVLLEAMALGKPVVVPNHSGCKDVVHSEKYGFLYHPCSLDDLTEKTKQALDAADGVGKNAQGRIAELYDWKILAKKIDACYDSLK